MIFTAPLGLLALLAIPAIIAIHMFRRRFPPRPVAGLFLWQRVPSVPESGGRVSRLPVTASLLLECLAALALALILSGARLRPASVTDHLVVLLDDSASMAARNTQGDSPRDRAVRRILAEVQEAGSSSRVTLVQSGERPSVLLGPAALAIEAEAALQTWQPQASHHDLAIGLRLARELAGKTSRLMVLTDAARAESAVADGTMWVHIGEPLGNVGVTAAQRTAPSNETPSTVLLTLGNFSGAAARRQLRVVAAGKDVLAREIDVPPGVSSLNLPLPPGLPAVQLRLSDDALQRDNDVVLVEPKPQIVGVSNRLSPGRGHDALLKAVGVLAGVTRAENGHLVFEDAGALAAPATPGAWRVAFGRAPGSLLTQGEPKDFIGPFVPEKRHPLLQGVTLGGVVWTGAYPLAGSGIHPLVSAGDQPLIALLPSTAASPDPPILFNLDLNRTNLIRAPDWPILISNLVEMRRQNLPGPDRWNYRIGEWVRIRLGREPRAPLRYRMGTVERALPAGRVLEFIAPSPGGLLQVVEGDEAIFDLGVNFLDEVESDLRDRMTGESGEFRAEAMGLRTETDASSDPLFWILLAMGGTAILANWCWAGYRRSNA